MIFQFISDYWEILLIPIISGLVGWITNVIALKMTFYPLEFKGIQPFLGWQGIIPSKAVKMAGISVNLMTTKLISVDEVFGRIEPPVASELVSPMVKETAVKLVDEIMHSQVSRLWRNMPLTLKNEIYETVIESIPAAVENLMADMKDNISELLDLRKLVVDVLLDDKSLINDIFLKVGNKEFKFIEVSGFYFGFLFGLVQMAVFYFYNPWWMLPLFGVFVGFATNWLAIKLIFNPVNAVNLGFFKLQGIFIKRQEYVASEYAKIIENKILTTERLFGYILRGPKSAKFSEIIKKYSDKTIDDVVKKIIPKYNWLVAKKIENSKNIALFRLKEEFPMAIGNMYAYAQTKMAIEETLRSKMAALSEVEFVEFLRPVFQEDEFKLILVGAILGGLAGLAQYFAFFY
jgi:uncharacterized membrane protein YheB (UPF0754 family)